MAAQRWQIRRVSLFESKHTPPAFQTFVRFSTIGSAVKEGEKKRESIVRKPARSAFYETQS